MSHGEPLPRTVPPTAGPLASAAVSSASSCRLPSCTIAVVGDVHNAWEHEDELALQHLGVDLVLLVGDFGNEAVEVVRAIAQMSLPKAVILGNHDAWYSATDWGRKLRKGSVHEDRVQQQLDLLGASHVGYGKLDLPALGLTVVGSRPFSWGGPIWKHGAFYRQRYDIDSFEASTGRIMEFVKQAAHETLIFIGHCGPAGLGAQPDDPCGKDWEPLGGDHGDPDFAAAIAQAQLLGKRVPLVAFGHMHHQLRYTKARLRRAVDVQLETLYLNAASVPRILQTDRGRLRNFSLVTLEEGVVTQASLVWVQDDFTVCSQQVLYQTSQPVLASS
ncbi:MAG: TIGR04168 family protein [Synechococcales cyanobacterium M58_A2018_015]|nr:TIGR04168 family protein [Synechococcales cyanobacterium M58_A2018_015]